MSSILDALRKIERNEQDRPKASFSIETEPPRAGSQQRWFWTGAAVAAALTVTAAGILWFGGTEVLKGQRYTWSRLFGEDQEPAGPEEETDRESELAVIAAKELPAKDPSAKELPTKDPAAEEPPAKELPAKVEGSEPVRATSGARPLRAADQETRGSEIAAVEDVRVPTEPATETAISPRTPRRASRALAPARQPQLPEGDVALLGTEGRSTTADRLPPAEAEPAPGITTPPLPDPESLKKDPAKPRPPAEPVEQARLRVEEPEVPPASLPQPEAAQGAGEETRQEEVLQRRPAGAPRVSVSFLFYSREPSRRRVMVTVNDGNLVTLFEGQSVEDLEVERILMDEVHFRHQGKLFAVRPRH